MKIAIVHSLLGRYDQTTILTKIYRQWSIRKTERN